MQPRYVVLVCHNERPPTNPKGCCKLREGPEILTALKTLRAKRGLKELFRATTSGCLGGCEHGATVLVSRTGADGEAPEVTYYSHFRPEDAEELVGRHLIAGEPLERLRSKPEWID